MLGMAADIFVIVSFFISLVLALLIAVPLAGTLVRFRANYNPKGLQLDGEGGVQPHTGPIVKSYFAMLFRVKRLEGWSGLYKGLMPGLVSTMTIVMFVSLLPGTSFENPGRHNKYMVPVDGIWNRLAYSLFMMVISLPFVIISNRSITTPYKLPWFNALYSLRVLLTPLERRRPWTLYFTPGLLMSEAAHVTFVTLIFYPIRSWIFPPLSENNTGALSERFTVVRLTLYLGLIVLGTAILTPLEVVSTRLSIQRNATPSEAEVDELQDTAVYAAAEEDVIGLRSDDDPYLGFTDCVKRIINEEGYRTLYRAWWLVLLPLLGGALA